MAPKCRPAGFAVPSSTTSPIDAATRDAVHAFLERISAEYPLHEAILFGSRAKGLARPDSEADVALILGGSEQSFMQTKLDMADTAFDVMLDTGVRIQPLPIWAGLWHDPDTWLNPELLHNIADTGVRLWQTHPN